MNPALRFANISFRAAESGPRSRNKADATPAPQERGERLVGVVGAASSDGLDAGAAVQSVASDQAPADVDALVETICSQGCKVVYQVIASLQAGEKLLETAHLDTPATAALLAELESIMAVYAENGSICLTKKK